LGKYYLYFSHHQGKYIRLAYADQVTGPWKIYKPGVFQNTESVFGNGPDKEMDLLGMKEIWVAHVASPDVVVDNKNKTFTLYYHGLGPKMEGCHCTSMVTSKDGLHFTPIENAEVVKESYFREFQYGGYHYFVGRLGKLFRSVNGMNGFEAGPNPFEALNKVAALRHPAVLLRHDTLLVFYSRMGDTPERIMVSKIALNNDWNTWKVMDTLTVLKPETDYEGANIELKTSKPGNATARMHEVRDPGIFVDDDKVYLLYSIQGESGLAIAELHFQ
jgi:hypothetical protein